MYANGDQYEGAMVDNKRDGKGVFFQSNGNKYEGDWANDMK